MSNRTFSGRSNRYTLPRRSKHQLYMNIIPLLPDFALIIKNIHRIREAKQKTAKFIQYQPKTEGSQQKQHEVHLELSSSKIVESHETCPNAIKPAEPQTGQKDKLQCENMPRRLRPRRGKKAPQLKKQRYGCKAIGKIRDQISFTLFNSIEEYFL